jgi:hypothetical protein
MKADWLVGGTLQLRGRSFKASLAKSGQGRGYVAHSLQASGCWCPGKTIGHRAQGSFLAKPTIRVRGKPSPRNTYQVILSKYEGNCTIHVLNRRGLSVAWQAIFEYD